MQNSLPSPIFQDGGNISFPQSLPSTTTVLIVDDEESDRATCIRYLQSNADQSYRIIEAETLKAGLELWRSQNPDILLVNVNLPDGDGLELLEAIDADYSDGKLPAIVLTGQGDERMAVRAMKLGAADYLVKGDLTAVSLCTCVRQVRDRTALTRQLLRSQKQEAVIAKIALRVRQHLDLEEVLNAIVEEVGGLLAADRVIVYQFNPDMSGTIVAEALVPPWPSCLNVQIIDTCFQSNLGGAYREGKVFAASDIYAANLTECHIQILERFEIRANLVVPILLPNRETQSLWGLLIVHQCSAPRHWEETDIRLLQQLSVQLAIAIQQAELYRELQFSEHRFRAIFDNMFQFIGLLSPDGIVLEANQTVLAAGGIAYEEVVGRPLWETYWWQISLPTQTQLRLAIARAARGEFVRYEVDIWGANQTVIPIDFSLRPILDRTGQVALLIPEGRDLTEAKRLETERQQAFILLRESEQRYATLVTAAPVGIFRTDAAGNCTYVNDRWCQIAGLAPEAAMGKGWQQGLHPDDRDAIAAEWERSAQENRPFRLEYRFQRSDGAVTWVYGQSVAERDASGQIIGYVGTITDISDRKQAEFALQELNQSLELKVEERTAELCASEAQIRATIEAIPDLLLRVTRDGTCLDYIHSRNPTGTFLSIQQHLSEVLPPELLHQQLDTIDRAIATGKLQIYEHQFQKYDWMVYEEVRIVGISQSEALIIVRDISDRKQIEAELAESEAKSRRLVEGADDALWSCDNNSTFTYLSPQFETLFGWNEHEWIGKPFLELVHPDDRPWLAAKHSENIQWGQKSNKSEFRQLHRDGRYIWVTTSVTPIRNAEGAIIGTQGILSDISDLKQVEIALRESEEKFRQLAEVIDVVFWILNLDRTERIYVSPAYERIWGKRCIDLHITPDSWLDSIYPEDRDRVVAQIEKQLRGEYDEEYRIVRPDGEIRWIRDRAFPIQNDQGQVYRIAGIAEDISDRKQTELVLQANQRFIQQIADASPNILYLYDIQEQRNIYANREIATIIGYTPTEIQAMGSEFLQNLMHPDDRSQLMAHFERLNAARDGEILEFEYRMRHANGEWHWLYSRDAVFSRDAEGRVKQSIGAAQDISDRKRAEKALRESEARWQFALEGAGDGIWDWNVQTNIVFFSRQWKAMLGYAEDEVGNDIKEWESRVHPNDIDQCYADLNKYFNGETPLYQNEHRLRVKDGSYKWIFSRGKALEWTEDGQPLRVIGTHTDISDRKQVQEELQESRAKFQRLVDDIGDKFVVFSHTGISGILTYVSDGIASVFGLRKEDVIFKSWMELIDWLPEDVEIARSSVIQMVENQVDFQQFDMRFIHPNGGQRTINVSQHPVRDNAGNPIAIDGIVEDITERKRAEAELQQVSERLALSLKSGDIGCWEWDIVANTLLWDERMYELYGVSKLAIARTDGEPISGMAYEIWANRLHPDDRIPTETLLQQAVLGQAEYDTEFRVIHPDGSIRFIKAFGMVVRDARGNPQSAIGVNFDISDRKQAEAQLQQTNQELARATRLKDEFLANMSHELRTPLNAILGMSEGLQEQVFGSVNPEQIRALQTIERSGSHLLELINDILDVAKIESGQLELDCTPTAVVPLCQSSLAFIKQLALKKRIQLEINLPHNLPDLFVDERRIRQVLINLLNNAVKFTSEGGRITLEVSRLQLAEGDRGVLERTDGSEKNLPPAFEFSLPPALPPQNYLRIAVIDTGMGIAPENINKLFHPFIQIDSALNRQYQGTGLGLALVKRIVELHGGQVGLISEVGVGSCFTIDLPCSAAASASPAPETQPEPRIEPSQSTIEASPLILLAEDNEANISTISSYLRAKGYRILLAKNGQEAIALAQSERPDLILMDIQMPGMDGLESMQQIRRNPSLVNVPIVALTALAMTGDRDRCLAAGANDYFSKPVKLKQLASTIQLLLAPPSR